MGAALFSSTELARLPLAAGSFSEIRTADQIYVDKTALVYQIAVSRAPHFLSRPKRFGKSMLVSTFETLFSKGLDAFEGLALEKLWHEDKTYKVLHLDFSQYADLNADKLSAMLSQRITDLMIDTAEVSPLDARGDFMAPGLVLERACDKVPISSLVLLVDEYDAPITHHLDDPVMREAIVGVINNFFASLKKCKESFRFIFVTGITRIAHVSLFSVFNNLKELTLTKGSAELVGFTEEEVHRYFHPYVENAAAVLDMTVEDVYSRLKTRYDGYRFTLDEDGQTLYNPWSVLSFLAAPEEGFDNYWYLSGGGTPSLLLENLKAHHVS
ncbi:MAG: AAA family ATPase, partial [Succinivibrio sp.]|nr:AAA family ATPase [Succinivibrio sp.]